MSDFEPVIIEDDGRRLPWNEEAANAVLAASGTPAPKPPVKKTATAITVAELAKSRPVLLADLDCQTNL